MDEEFRRIWEEKGAIASTASWSLLAYSGVAVHFYASFMPMGY